MIAHAVIFDDLDRGGSYASHSVMVPRLSDLSVADWISAARDFVADID